MCTVVTRWQPGEPVRILAIRDEFVSRDFDQPGIKSVSLLAVKP